MEKNFYGIFITFFKVGTILLGGGYVILPLLTNELVDKRGWLTADELVEYYAISSSLPGVIAVNTAVFTGNKLYGFKGAVAGICGVILPAFIAIIIIASIFNEITGYTCVKNMFWGVGIGVITLLFLAVKEMWNKSINDVFSGVVYAVCLILALWGKIPLAIIIIGALICGVVNQILKERRKSDV